MINIENNSIQDIKIGSNDIDKVYAGEFVIWKRHIVNIFVRKMAALGIITSSNIYDLYDALPSDIKTNAKVILLPVAIAMGKVYAMDNTTGDPIEFDFRRNSNATRFDSDMNMELVAENIPRVDFGNYGNEIKLLIEKESTNLVINNISNWSAQNGTLSNTTNDVLGDIITYTENLGTLGLHRAYTTTITSPSNNLFSTLVIKDIDRKYCKIRATYLDGHHLIVFDLEEKKIIQNTGILDIVYTEIEDNFIRICFKSGELGIASTNTWIYTYNQSISSSIDIDFIGEGKSIQFKYIQQELQLNTPTSYIPTLSSQVTRSPDLMSYILENNSEIIIKTSKNGELNLSKNSGQWNIHDDIPSSDGIEYLAIIN